MTDDLDQLKAALKTATPTPDASARDKALALAQRNFDILQQATHSAHLENTPSSEQIGFFDQALRMFEHFGLRLGLYAVSGIAVLGIGIMILTPELSKKLLVYYFQPGPEPTEFMASVETTTRSTENSAPVIKQAQLSESIVVQEENEQTTVHELVKLGISEDTDQTSVVPGSIEDLVSRIASGSEHSVLRIEQPMRDAGPVATSNLLSPKRAWNNQDNNAFAQLSNSAQDSLQEMEQFANGQPNTLKIVSEEPVSTFSIDVDTASYSFVRSSIMHDRLPRMDAVRVEEMINYFSYDYSNAEDENGPFSTSVAVLKTPWNQHTKLVRIGIQGETVPAEDRPDLDLVFLIDTSGSMRAPDKLPLLKQSLQLLLAQLKPTDRVSIVTYAGSSGVALEPTPASDRATILTQLGALRSDGGTAGHEGLQTAYWQAEKMRGPGRVGRVILATDGDFNVGISGEEKLKRYVEDKKNNGIYLSVLGFGQEYYNDGIMQALAQNGNGIAAHIDTTAEAMKVLVDQLSGTLVPIANDVKIQVEFNPTKVAEYRLIGYETRALAREDFNNDKVDAGEIGSGHTVTALYEITPVGSLAQKSDKLRYQSNADTKNSVELGFLKLRYKSPGESESQLIETPIIDGRAENSGDAQFAAAIAGFGQLLRGDTKYLGSWFYPDAIALAHSATGADQYGYRAEAVQLMKKVSAIDLTDNSFIDPSNLSRDTPMVQLGAFESARIAKSEWAWISRRFESYFEGKGPVIQRRATSGGKVFYRLRAVGFENMDAARRFCSLLKAENIDCIRVAAR
ncbi:von Willebrand factor type A domain-containing protein [bacterium]|nr:von Willebrand factor type A domain-containing protein [bacterium]